MSREPFLPSYALGDEVVLRPVTAADRSRLFGAIDGDRERLRAWLPWVDGVIWPSSLTPFLDDTARQHRSGTALRLLVEVDGDAGGVASLEEIDAANRKAFIGYWLAARYEGRGLVTRAVLRLCGYAFEERRLNRIELRAAPDNHRSRAVPERLGFAREGQLRQSEWVNDHFKDSVVYSLLRSEWPALKARP